MMPMQPARRRQPGIRLSGWTDQRIAALRKFWADGLSASQIAARIAGATRNAVLGKAHRLGLAARAPGPLGPRTYQPRVRRQRPFAWPPVAAVVAGVAADEPADAVPSRQRCTLAGLGPTCCRWPIGTPGQADFCYCGGPAVERAPYCAHHMRMAYQEVTGATGGAMRCRRAA